MDSQTIEKVRVVYLLPDLVVHAKLHTHIHSTYN